MRELMHEPHDRAVAGLAKVEIAMWKCIFSGQIDGSRTLSKVKKGL